ncbi:hypothetical protein HS088_TW07G00027 [Tripterygium wilfordii]|uniref:Uncharacterized protein n=1 Tax=Tripterygium wilfordii TaxID=458696 RepID=A0A7J7DEF7_TRIWF|nr:hypothetical protein HS088_TW07G00027 [Tripterygium wilfordii]
MGVAGVVVRVAVIGRWRSGSIGGAAASTKNHRLNPTGSTFSNLVFVEKKEQGMLKDVPLRSEDHL